MIGPLLRWLSARHWLEHPVRTGLTVLGVSLGVAVVVGVDLLAGEILAANRRSLEAIAGKAQLTVTAGETGMDREVADRIFKLQGVAHVEPLLERQLVEPDRGPILLLGVDFLGDNALRQVEADPADQEVIDDPIAFLNSTKAVVVPESFATRRGLKKGQSFSLATGEGSREFVIKGLVRDRGPARAFGGDVVLMYLDAAQVALGMGDRVSRIDIGLDEGVAPETAKRAIAAELGPAFTVDFPMRRGARLEQLMAGLSQALYTMAALAIAVGILLAYNAVEISVRQRRRELAILRAIGTDRRIILTLVLIEAVLVGAIATVVGLSLGYVLARLGLASTAQSVSDLYDVVKVDEVTLAPRHVIMGGIVGLLIPFVGALRPARWIAGEPPVAGLTRSAAEEIAEPSLWRGLGVGVAVCAFGVAVLSLPIARESMRVGYMALGIMLIGAIFLAPSVVSALARATRRLFGWRLAAEEVIALDHVIRDRRRAALNVASLVAGVAAVLTVATYVTSLHFTYQRWLAAAVPADLFVTAGSKLAMTHNTPMDTGLGDDLRRLPGVDAVFQVRVADYDFHDRPIRLVSAEMGGYLQYGSWLILEGGVRPDGPTVRGHGVLVSENLARREGLKAGDPITLPTPSGPRDFQIEAVVVDFTSDQGVILFDRQPYVSLFKDDRVDSFDLFLKQGVDPLPIQQQIRQEFGTRNDLFVLTNSEFKAEAQRLIDQIFALLDLLQLVTLLIAVLGVSTTLVAAVLDRTREVGVMRAVGATPGQVIRIVLVEAGFIGATASILGAALGTLCGAMFLRSILVATVGWALPWVVPGSSYVVVLLGVTYASVIAGIYPAWWSARQPTLDAIQTD
jgi:putative ABC transport system permease protein